MEKHTLVYDAGCGPCTRFRRAVDFLDAHNGLEYSPLIDADRNGLLESVSPSRRHRSFHLVSPGGEVLSGANAIPRLIGLLPAGSLVLKLVVSAPLGYKSIAFVYSTFSRLHDAGSCSYGSRGSAKSHMRKTGIFGDWTTLHSSRY